MHGYLIRPAEVRDARIIAEHRGAMFRDMGLVSAEESNLLIDASETWLSGLLANEGYFGWLVEHEDLVVAGGGILLRELGPTPGCLRLGRWAHVVNIYTEPGHRRRGLARSLMSVILDWCAANAIDQVTLAASDEGRPLYESIGFTATADMKLRR
jgi:GNAT superfamily N-acetyltransferase